MKIKNYPLVLLLLFLGMFLFSASLFAQENEVDEWLKEYWEENVAISKTIHDRVFKGKIPIYLDVQIDEDKAIENRVSSLITKKLREFGDISIIAKPEKSIASIYILGLMHKPTKYVTLSVTVCRNSIWLAALHFKDGTRDTGLQEYVTSLVTTNRIDSFSSNINYIVDTFNRDILEEIRRHKDIIILRQKEKK
jgi:hypothetical protein